MKQLRRWAVSLLLRTAGASGAAGIAYVTADPVAQLRDLQLLECVWVAAAGVLLPELNKAFRALRDSRQARFPTEPELSGRLLSGNVELDDDQSWRD